MCATSLCDAEDVAEMFDVVRALDLRMAAYAPLLAATH